MKGTIIETISGDILEARGYEAIVNPTNPTLLPGDTKHLDSKIHKLAGKKLKAKCTEITNTSGKCGVGRAVITDSFELSDFRNIIHTVAPPAYRNGQDEFLFESCFEQVLYIAFQNGIKTIAIPAVGGKYRGTEKGRAAEAAVNAVNRFCRMHPDAFSKISFIIDDPEYYEMYYGLIALTAEYRSFVIIRAEDISFCRDAVYGFLFGMFNEAKLKLSEKDRNYQKKMLLIKTLENSMKLSHDMRLDKTLAIPVRSIYQRILKFMKVFRISEKTSILRILSKSIDDINLVNENGKLTLYASAHNFDISDLMSEITKTYFKNDILMSSVLDAVNASLDNQQKNDLLRMMLEKADPNQILNKTIEKICDSPVHGRAQDFLQKLELEAGKIEIIIS